MLVRSSTSKPVAQPQFSSWGTTLTFSGLLRNFGGDQYIDGPMDQKVGGTSPPVPMVVAPMF
jgi:hypothetical protein